MTDSMPCELFECCQFFKDNMKNLPKSAEYIRMKLCRGEYQTCSRYRVFKEFGGQNVPPFLNPSDAEEVNKALQCLRKKKKQSG